MNKRSSLYIGVALGASALYFAACGDDVLVTEGGDNIYTTSSLDSVECTKETEGAMAFVKPTATMYACSDGKWVEISASDAIGYRCKSELLKDSSGYAIICDGDSIGTIKNGTIGKSAYDLAKANKMVDTTKIKNEKDWVASLKGEAGKNAYEIAKENGMVDTTKIKNEKEWIESLNGACQIVKVESGKTSAFATIRCGDAESEIELPFSKNLSNVYKKTVMLKLPYLDNSDDCRENCNSVNSTAANLTVMELNGKALQVGKSYSFDMASTDHYSMTVVPNNRSAQDVNDTVYSLVLLGDVEMTNLSDSLVQLRADVAYQGAIDGSSTIAMSAVVKLDDHDTIVINFLTDYKAARVKVLMADGKKSYDDASKQANKELVEALYRSADDFGAFEYTTNDPTNIYDNSILSVWPWILSNLPYQLDYNRVYADFKKSFAENGTFKKTVAVYFNGDNVYDVAYNSADGFYYDMDGEYPMYFVDLFAFAINNNESSQYKMAQEALIDVYALPEAKRDTFVERSDKNGYFNWFSYSSRTKLWTPVTPGNIDYCGLGNLLWGNLCEDDHWLKDNDHSVTLVAGKKLEVYMKCDNDDNDGYCWTLYHTNDVDFAPCGANNEGETMENVCYSGSGKCTFKCEKNKEGKYGWSEFLNNEVAQYSQDIGRRCEESIVGQTFSATKNSTTYYTCEKAGGDYYYWNWECSTYDDEHAASCLKKIFGCNSEKDGDVEYVMVDGERTPYVCKYSGQVGEWSQTTEAGALLGKCDESVMNKHELRYIDKGEYDDGVLHTKKAAYKCDHNGYEVYQWIEVDDLDLEFYVCDHGYASAGTYDNPETGKYKEGYYRCKTVNDPDQSSSSAKWVKKTATEYCRGHYEVVSGNDYEYGEYTTAICEFENIIYEASSAASADDYTNSAFMSGEQACENKASWPNYHIALTYKPGAGTSSETMYYIFLPGVSDVFEIYSSFTYATYNGWSDPNCNKIVGASEQQTYCKALYYREISDLDDGDSYCNLPCVYKGKTYYYNNEESKWTELNKCPTLEDQCGKTCTSENETCAYPYAQGYTEAKCFCDDESCRWDFFD